MSEQPVPVQMRLERIYLKDASFESPNSPQVFAGGQWRPEIKVDLNTKSTALDGDRHEVVLRVIVEASLGEEGIGFIVEVHQAGVSRCGHPLRKRLQRVSRSQHCRWRRWLPD